MNIFRAIWSGVLVWALIFVEWSILIFAPVVKDMEKLQYAISYILLIPIVIFGVSYYYKSEAKNENKTNGIIIGLIMLATGAVLDSIITVPFFIKPQGMGYTDFFLSITAIAVFIEYLIIAEIYWMKKVK